MKLKDWLKANSITEAAFADAIQRSQSAVNRIKNGHHRPEWDTMKRIEDATEGAVTYRDFMPDSEAAR